MLERLDYSFRILFADETKIENFVDELYGIMHKCDLFRTEAGGTIWDGQVVVNFYSKRENSHGVVSFECGFPEDDDDGNVDAYNLNDEFLEDMHTALRQYYGKTFCIEKENCSAEEYNFKWVAVTFREIPENS